MHVERRQRARLQRRRVNQAHVDNVCVSCRALATRGWCASTRGAPISAMTRRNGALMVEIVMSLSRNSSRTVVPERARLISDDDDDRRRSRCGERTYIRQHDARKVAHVAGQNRRHGGDGQRLVEIFAAAVCGGARAQRPDNGPAPDARARAHKSTRPDQTSASSRRARQAPTRARRADFRGVSQSVSQHNAARHGTQTKSGSDL